MSKHHPSLQNKEIEYPAVTVKKNRNTVRHSENVGQSENVGIWARVRMWAYGLE
jgi:hypothetical protein